MLHHLMMHGILRNNAMTPCLKVCFMGETVAMEAEAGLQDQGMGVHSQAKDKAFPMSYVNAVTGDSRSSQSLNENSSFLDEEVEVLNEDCLIDESGPFPSIRFSDRQPDRQATPIGPSVDQPYGPWMVVDNSRHKPRHGNMSIVASQPARGVQGASRFAVLEEMQVENGMAGGANVRKVIERPRPIIQGVEMENGAAVGPNVIAPKEFTPNVVYLASNPGKKKKSGDSSEVVEVEVVPSLEDPSPKMIVRSLEHVRGDHTAVAIKENSLHGKGSVGVWVGKTHGVVNKNFKENPRHGILGSKWALQVSNDLNLLGHQMTGDASTSGGVSGGSVRIINYLVESSGMRMLWRIRMGWLILERIIGNPSCKCW
ncbi:hypothetical protein V6N11_008129 [Hibiscus sabdariffa]|uniref:Uncharacterized protein n=1 Tax=Hibiscus sabdariffa TaxID=183260 RepID=A0ABR2Q086_9ROSI